MAGIGNHPYLLHYVLAEGSNEGECRPAALVREWTDEPQEYANLAVFVDGPNDGLGDELVVWKTSVYHTVDGAGHTYHQARECENATAVRAEADANAAASPTSTPPAETADPTPPAVPGSAASSSDPSANADTGTGDGEGGPGADGAAQVDDADTPPAANVEGSEALGVNARPQG